jgi:hypothetical protein
MSDQLYWHCATCGDNEPAQPDYERGDKEPCVLCEDGVAVVMTLQEGAKLEQEIALGLRTPPKARYLTDEEAKAARRRARKVAR